MPFFEGLAPGPNFPGQEKMVLLLLRPRTTDGELVGGPMVSPCQRKMTKATPVTCWFRRFSFFWKGLRTIFDIRLLNIWRKKNQGKIFYAYNTIIDINTSNSSNLMNYELVLQILELSLKLLNFFRYWNFAFRKIYRCIKQNILPLKKNSRHYTYFENLNDGP